MLRHCCNIHPMNRRNMSTHDIGCAERFNQIWHEKKRILGLTQERAAERIGLKGTTFNQYLNGKAAMNMETKLKVANLLGVEPELIDPEIGKYLPPSDLTADESELIAYYRKLSPDMKRICLSQVKALFDSVNALN